MRIGIIGTGRMGKNHLRIMNGFKYRIENLSVYDKDTELLHQLACIYDINHHHNLDLLLEESDAVIIATPTSTHYEIAERCLAMGKDVFIEKPMTATVEEAVRLSELVRKSGRLCMIGHVERFNPSILYLREYMQGKQIMHISSERISKLEKNRSFDVDVIVDLMIHDIDVVLSIVDSKPEKVFAVSCDPVLNIAQAMLQFENGVVATFSASRSSSEKIRRLSVYTADENVKVDYLNYKVEKARLASIEKSYNTCKYNIVGESEAVILEGEPLYLELKHFLDCLETGETPMSDESNGFTALKIAEDMIKHIKESR